MSEFPVRTRGLRQTTPPAGLFRGVNVMTREVLGYYKLREGFAELSAGRGMTNNPIFGVTVRPDTDPKRSKLCHSRAEAIEYIESLSW